MLKSKSMLRLRMAENMAKAVYSGKILYIITIWLCVCFSWRGVVQAGELCESGDTVYSVSISKPS